MGWAVVPGYGIETTTGGAGGEIVTVTNVSDFKKHASGSDPKILLVKGQMSAGRIDIGNNKTILGQGTDAKFTGELAMNKSQNVIIRNMEVTGGRDAISARETNHIWLDHNYVHKASDGLIDITLESDYYTISWTELANHDKTMLLNGGSRVYRDRGFLNGTVHHNWFNQTNQRNPRAGFGKIHIFNDYNYKNKSYGIGFHTESLVYAEANFFEGMDRAIDQMYNSPGKDPEELGDALAVGNKFKDASGDESTGLGFDPTDLYIYDFALDNVDDVPAAVKAGSGQHAKYAEIGLMPIPGQGTVAVSSGKLSWKTGTHSAQSYVVYFGTTTNPPKVAASIATSYDAGSLSGQTQYYWRVDQVTADGTIEGKLWTFKTQ